MAKEPSNTNGNVFLFSDYYDPDPETTALMNTPEWMSMCAQIDRDDFRKRNMNKIRNDFAAKKLAMIIKIAREIAAKAEFEVKCDVKYSEHEDFVSIDLIGIGIDLEGEGKKKFQSALEAADLFQAQVSNDPDKVNLSLVVGNLHIYQK